jgi:hypothetical protein
MKLESTGITHIYSTGVPMAKPDAVQYDKDGNEMAHWRFNPPAPKQEPYGYFRYDIKLDAWVQNKESAQGVAFYTAPVHASDISQERVDETAKYRHDLVYRLRKRAEIRRQIPDRKSVQEGQPDRIADLLEEAADALEKREWVGLDGDIPGLGLVTEEFYNGMLCAEDILREKNT